MTAGWSIAEDVTNTATELKAEIADGTDLHNAYEKALDSVKSEDGYSDLDKKLQEAKKAVDAIATYDAKPAS